MICKSAISSSIFLLLSSLTFSQQINVGILSDKNPKKLTIIAATGKYVVRAENKKVCKLNKNKTLTIDYTSGRTILSNEHKVFGFRENIEIVSRKYKFNTSHDKANTRKNAELQIKLSNPELKVLTYQGNLRIIEKEKNIQMTNQIAMPDYLAGVVEAESGSKCEFEYYKNQAVVCRTYALKSLQNHVKEGFQLCDGVHCQAYKGKSTLNPIIQNAVKETDNLVIVDSDGELISAVFSANCGGLTNNSEDVWSTPFAYLKSFRDSFCTDQPQAFWTKKIAFADFKKFLKEKKLNIPDTLSIDSFAFTQPERKIMYPIFGHEIKLTTIRLGLGLRSTYFDIKPDGQNLIFAGKGYGHGVGMCQEGAMNMARKGYKFDEIIKYYYKGARIQSKN